jgi:hypothetical protein
MTTPQDNRIEEIGIKLFIVKDNESNNIIKYEITDYENANEPRIIVEETFINKDGVLLDNIKKDLSELLKTKLAMVEVYKNYIEQNRTSTERQGEIGKNSATQLKLIRKNLGKGIFRGGKKTKSKRSYNVNKTLKKH